MSQPTKQLFEFGRFRLDPIERLLYCDGEVVSLTAKIFDILLVFVRNSGRTLDKEEMMREVWPDQFVEEGNLTRNVSTLRKALGESQDNHRYIVTIPGRGYRFVGEVRETQVEVAKPSDVEGDRSNVRRSPRRAAKWSLATFMTLAALTVAGFYAWRSIRSNATGNELAVGSIAVLPFKPLGPEGNDEYFGLGMADALITKLSNFKQIVVRPTSAVRRYTAPDQDPLAAGRELKVDVEQGLPYYYSRQYKRAEEEFRQAQKLEPRFTPLVYMLAMCYEEEGKFEEAIALFQAAMAGYQSSPRMSASLTRVYATSGRRVEARRLLKEALAHADSRRLAPYYVAQIYARLDEKDQAFAWLARACEERDEQIVMIKVDPKMDVLRSDPRFSDLLRSIGLLR